MTQGIVRLVSFTKPAREKPWAIRLLFNKQGLVNDVLGTVRLTDNIMAKVGDESVRDSVRGTYVWTHQRLTCPDTISQIYRGPMKFYVNSSDPNMEGGLAVLEKDDLYGTLELFKL